MKICICLQNQEKKQFFSGKSLAFPGNGDKKARPGPTGRIRAGKNVIFISFNLDNLIMIKELYPEQKVQYLRGDFEDGLIDLLVKYNMDLDIYYQGLSKEKLDECHKHNILVNCWTVDNPSDAEKLAEWGVDYITSNILE